MNYRIIRDTLFPHISVGVYNKNALSFNVVLLHKSYEYDTKLSRFGTDKSSDLWPSRLRYQTGLVHRKVQTESHEIMTKRKLFAKLLRIRR